MSFRAEQLGYKYGLRGASFELPDSGFIAIIGPNGAGKSTLASILAGIRPDYDGYCTYKDTELRKWPRHKLAHHVAFLPQSMRVEFPFTAEQVVYMGRTPRSAGWFDSPGDAAAVERAMQTTGTLEFRARDFRTLSGGERQRVVLAAAMAQEPSVLLLDEPATFLDLRHQLEIYRILSRFSKQLLVIAVTHDLNLALRYADRIVALVDGNVAADGPAAEVLTPRGVLEIFGIDARIHQPGLPVAQLGPPDRPLNDQAGRTSAWIEYDA